FLQTRAGDRIAHGATPSFDSVTWEVWAPLLNGGTIVVIDRDQMLSPTRLGAVIREQRVTSLFLTPVLFGQVAYEAPDAFRPLRDVMTGGEAADPAAFARVLAACPETRVINVYGPSECTTYATWHLAGRNADPHAAIPIGIPVTNTRVYVLDRWLRAVPPGVPGELCLAGDGLARGYLGRPALTAERFVPDPYAERPGGWMYRTGDLGRWKYDESAKVRECESASDSRENERTFALSHSRTAVLEFLSRMDGQAKVRGFRIEPGEIEVALRRHPAVADALATVGGEGERRWVAAYVVAVPGAAPTPQELRGHLSSMLPGWMIPAFFIPLDALPKTPAGKLDRRALPPPAPGAALAEDAWAPPETPTEAAVAAIWSEVLEVDRVGATDDFFDLGGHSLKATRIFSRVSARLGVELPVGVIFDDPTVRGMAARVDERLGEAPAPEAELLDWLEGLTDEEAERLLAESRAGG
ncbi:MAG TPA: non-ribosomal peptide synthetase, partial [Longimicrobium sp.]|nr:non-ribosomal peptide synthetase [Longimicrobium sp.]